MSRKRFLPVAGVVGAAMCAALVAAAVTPATAGEYDAAAGSSAAVVGAFGIGDGLEASVDEKDGAWRVALPAANLELAWDSRAAGRNPHGFGSGWSLSVGRVATKGGARVFPASGGEFPMNSAEPSGLSGYGLEDLRFEALEGELPGRDLPAFAGGAGGADRPSVAYRYVLRELGGSVTYFDAEGNPVVREFPHGRRQDWIWDAERPGRLTATIDLDGAVDVVEWDAKGGSVSIRPAANLPAHPDPITGEVPAEQPAPWRITIGRDGLSAIEDPTGGVVSVRYARDSRLVSGVAGASGASTEVEWQPHTDGVTRVRSVRTVDALGRELSKREWSAVGGSLGSGWPAHGSGTALPTDPAHRYRTEMSDGKTRVVSEYNALHVLVERQMVATGASGEFTLQEQSFRYPWSGDPSLPDPSEVRGSWAKPTSTEVVFRDASGAERSSIEAYEFDAFGRPVSATAADGTLTRTVYDTEPAGPGRPAIGLPVEETVIAPDGLVTLARHTLNDERTAVVVTETFTGSAPAQLEHPEQLVPSGRIEVKLDERGAVVEQRVYPTGGADAGAEAEPAVTRWQHEVDLASGTRTTTETAAAGTTVETTASATVSLRHGQVLEQVDPLGNESRAGYDALGRPVIEVEASGLTTERRYERAASDGRAATTTIGPDGVEMTEVLDPLGRVVELHDNLDRGVARPGFVRVAERRDYPEPGVVRVTDAWGATTEARQDVLGRPVATILPSGLVELKVHDDVANTVTTALTATGSIADAELVSTHTNDTSGRTVSTSTTRADGAETRATRIAYDGLGRETRTRDGALDIELEFDAYGNPERTTYSPDTAGGQAGASMTVMRRFDGFGTTLEKTVASGEEWSTGGRRELDALGRPFREVDRVGRVTTTEYTLDGLVERVIAGSGKVSEMTYHPVTRALLSSTVSSPIGATVRTAYDVDPVTGAVLGVYGPEDRTATEIRTTYDDALNPLTVTYPDGTQIEYRYDAHGRRTHLIDVADNVTEYTYSGDGLLARAVQRDAVGELLTEVAYTRDAFGRVTSLTRANGVTTEYTYTSASEIATEVTTGRDGESLSEREYVYDARGNLIQRTDELDPTSTPTRRAGDRNAEASTDLDQRLDAVTTTSYRYDAFDRLIASEVRRGDATAQVIRAVEYDLTASDDIAVERVTELPGTPDAATTSRAFRYSPLGELLAVDTTDASGVASTAAQEYDAAGNLVRSIDGSTYAYNAADRPVSQTMPDGTTVRTAYWADSSRRSVDGGGARTEFYWDGAELVNDVHAASTPAAGGGIASYPIADGRQARAVAPETGPATVAYLGADRHGNVVDTTDGEGSIRSRTTYSDYGAPTSWFASGASPATELERNPIGHAGSYENRDGSQHLDVRTYDVGTMRFEQLDDAGLQNDFAFGDLNPIMNVDPTGRTSETDRWLKAGLALLLTFAGAVATVVSGGSAGLMVGFAIAGAFESAVATAQVANETLHFMDDSTSTLLGHIALGVGVGTAVLGGVGAVVRTVGRTLQRATGPEGARLALSALRKGGLRGYGTGMHGGVGVPAAGAPATRHALPSPGVQAQIDSARVLAHDARLADEVASVTEIKRLEKVLNNINAPAGTRVAALGPIAVGSAKHMRFLSGIDGLEVRRGTTIWEWLGRSRAKGGGGLYPDLAMHIKSFYVRPAGGPGLDLAFKPPELLNLSWRSYDQAEAVFARSGFSRTDTLSAFAEAGVIAHKLEGIEHARMLRKAEF
jgi:RHS repeat-associated protein